MTGTMPCASLGFRAARDRRATQGRLIASGWPAVQPSRPALQEDVPLPAKGPSRTRLETHSLETRPGGAPWHRRSDCWLVGHPNPHCHSALSVQPPGPALPLGPERTVSVRSTSSGSVRACSPYVHHRVAVWAALPLGPERAAPRGRHCHSGLSAPFRYVRRRVSVWSALPLGPGRAAPRGRHCHSALDAPFWYARRRVAV